MKESAIIVDQLTRHFQEITAVDNLSFSVKKGELFGLLGPNGAGKTTTINMLSTLLRPSDGHATVAGHDIYSEKDAVRYNIGVVFQDTALDIKLTGLENLEFHGMMYNISKTERKRRIDEVLELVELSDRKNALVETYSGGMKRRLEIARGLIHRPTVLFLDEPTLGLDAQTRRTIWEYIKMLNKKHNVTIILTTHYMEEADFLCDRIAIIDKGKVVALDTPEKLKEKVGGDVITLEIAQDSDKIKEKLSQLKWIHNIKSYNNHISLGVDKGDKKIPELIKCAENCGVSIESVNLRKPSLEDVFIHFTGRKIREQEGSMQDWHRDIRARMMRR